VGDRISPFTVRGNVDWGLYRCIIEREVGLSDKPPVYLLGEFNVVS